MTSHPVVYWAQRSNKSDPTKNICYLTIKIIDPIDIKYDISLTTFQFSASSKSEGKKYEMEFDFYDEVDTEDIITNFKSGSKLFFIIKKKNLSEDYWPRLIKDTKKNTCIKTDFDRWVDQEDQNEVKPSEDDLSNIMNMGGGPGGLDIAELMKNSGRDSGFNPDSNFDMGNLDNSQENFDDVSNSQEMSDLDDENEKESTTKSDSSDTQKAE